MRHLKDHSLVSLTHSLGSHPSVGTFLLPALSLSREIKDKAQVGEGRDRWMNGSLSLSLKGNQRDQGRVPDPSIDR
jgi:hypothetical protein